MARLESNLPNLIQEWVDAEEGRTQQELAIRANINPATLSRVINSNAKRIDIDMVHKLREVIGFDLGKVFREVAE